MKITFLFLFLGLICSAVSCQTNSLNSQTEEHIKNVLTSTKSDTLLLQRFSVPDGYTRIPCDKYSYAYYLRNVKLKPNDARVNYFDGSEKKNNQIYCAVIDQPISDRDLQQCADAVMRLRGEYLFSQKRFSEIHFNFLSDNKPRYFKDYGDKTNSYNNFLKYMDYVFAFANTRSLYNELLPVLSTDLQIGDVFIQTGNPYGHAVTVMDLAENENGEKIFLLSQSYMPAQETQILMNPTAHEISPWYTLKKQGDLITPEWNFKFSDLRRFKAENN